MFEKLKINSKLLKQLDASMLLIAVIIVLYGTINIYSAKPTTNYFKLQLIWLLLGLFVTYVILIFDYSLIANYATVIYWLGVLLLILNDFIMGHTAKGATSWIAIGNRAIQPSEFAKLGMIIMLAKKLEDMEGNINNVKNFIILTFYAAVPMLLIIIQPDMGMTMVSFFIVLGIYYACGLDLRVIIGGISSLIILIAGVWNSGLMKYYWKARLISFLNPEADASGLGLQLIQSQIAIGSGGILGKGFTKGTQIGGGFVPEAHNDFIFAVIGEEWGLIGAIVLLILYGILIYRFIVIARNSKDIFGSVLCVGVISTFLFSVLQNIGMAIGIMPITGITLPLMSYGGSSILTSFIAIGLILNVGMRKKKINF